jgi:hypothetical protein
MMIASRLIASLCITIGLVAAACAGWLIWQAPHCLSVAARAHYTPLDARQGGRGACVLTSTPRGDRR